MARRPFDPRRIDVPKDELPLAQPPDGGKAGGDGAITVARLTQMIRQALVDHLPPRLVVAGEISNLARPASGHVYFTLKDADSEVRCVMWRSAAGKLRFRPEDGMEVLATGGIDVYEPRGQVQLYVTKLEPKGIGELELAFRQLREKLQAEGLFDPARKRPLPAYPDRIAVVTSENGAAVRDILRTVGRRYPCVDVLIYPVRVQGEGAAAEIAQAIGAIDRQADRLDGVDLMIVGRGGGSLEDLWAFNEEVVARAIFACRLPIISAVGHEVDVTISDLVADVRAATPTAAAELAVPMLSELLEAVDDDQARLRRAMGHRLDLARRDLTAVERCELFRRPVSLIRRCEQELDELGARQDHALARRMDEARTALHRCELAVRSIHPQTVLHERSRRLDAVTHRLRWAQGARNVQAERSLERARRRLQDVSPRHALRRAIDRTDHIERQLARATVAQHRQFVRDLDALAARLRASGHEAILRRGFSITRLRREGRIVTNPDQVHDGDRIQTTTAGGTFDSRVVDKDQLELFE